MRTRCIAFLLFLPLLLAAPAAAEAPAWDQQRVSRLADRLVKALEALLTDPELHAQQGTAMQQREHEAAIATANELGRRAVNFKTRIEIGYSEEDSKPFWDEIDELRGDIQAYARHSWLPPETDAKADRVSELLDELALYYSDDR